MTTQNGLATSWLLSSSVSLPSVRTLLQWRACVGVGVAHRGAGITSLSLTTHSSGTPTALPDLTNVDALFRLFLYSLVSNLLDSNLNLLILRSVGLSFLVKDLAFVWVLASRIFQNFSINLNDMRSQLRYKWRHAALCIYSSVALSDPHLLMSWLQASLPGVALFAHRYYFRLLFSLLNSAVLRPAFSFKLVGLSLYLVGKISVTGNARSRALGLVAGVSSAANLKFSHASAFSLVSTNTGCLGFTVRYVF